MSLGQGSQMLEEVIPEGCEELDQLECCQEIPEIVEITQEQEGITGNLYALIGNPHTRCLRLQGYIARKPLQILIDGAR